MDTIIDKQLHNIGNDCGNNTVPISQEFNTEKELKNIVQELISHHLNLSFHLQSDDEDGATEEEAKLLMNLSLSPIPSSYALNGGSTKKSKNRSIKKKKTKFVNCSSSIDNKSDSKEDEDLHVSCPSLSLFPSGDDNNFSRKLTTAQSILKIPLKCEKRNDIQKSISNALLNNIGSAFTFALQTRVQSWMDSLERVIQLRSNQSANSSSGEITEEDSVSSCENMIDSSKNSKECIVLNALTQVQNYLCITVMKSRFQVVEQEPNQKKVKTVHFNDDNDLKSKSFPIELNVSVLCNLKNCDDSMMMEDRYITITAPGKITAKYSSNLEGKEQVTVTGIDIDLNISLFIQSLLDKSRFIIRQYTEDFMIRIVENKQLEEEYEDNHKDAHCSSPTFSSSSVDSLMMPPPPPTHDRNSRHLSIISPPPLSPTSMLPMTTPKVANTTNSKSRPALVSPPLQSNGQLSLTDNTTPKRSNSSIDAFFQKCIKNNKYPSFLPTLDEIEASKELYSLRQRSYTSTSDSSSSEDNNPNFVI